ncbi:hypothetical protein PR202_gb10275 [Eleusine coracana subsp. coracana]|uniref:Uncharacterized protein n=1 Tax=Eleusine coracana subsp. coracana TaxID=191504 RepID=A0AAV5EIV9_ELECO|nr:hypothetical protein QOZ80_3BG0253670 [Eleusine coracana subsp. coracana]GJN22683.1 hypothetical protein PR202_gb10275 [Eleusine coracana subsp. coracana]
MSHGGGGGSTTGGQPSCTTVSFGKAMRRAFRAATGMKKKPKKKAKDYHHPIVESTSSSMERITSFSSSSSSSSIGKDSVVRVVLKSGVVEAYPGVVLACTVIQKHPPGLCLAHPDVFRNPHGAVVRPLEPLFPGQKFLLLPESTVIHLKQKIPESSIGAFADDEDEDASEEDREDNKEYYSSGGTATASSSGEEEVEDTAAAGDEGGFMAGCNAREFFVANERWSKCQFKRLVDCGLAVEQSTDQPAYKGKKKGKKKRRKGKTKKRKDRRVAAPAGLGTSMMPRRMWEPSLPVVVEEEEDEEACLSSHHNSSEASTPEIVSEQSLLHDVAVPAV